MLVLLTLLNTHCLLSLFNKSNADQSELSYKNILFSHKGQIIFIHSKKKLVYEIIDEESK